MKEIMKYLQWIIYFQPIGFICAFIAYFLPGNVLEGFKGWLFNFGIGITVIYWFYLFTRVYLPLKKKQ